MRNGRVRLAGRRIDVYDPECPLCTLRYGKILIDWRSEGICVVEAIDENNKPIPGVYLLLPTEHLATNYRWTNDWAGLEADAISALKSVYDITIDNTAVNLTPRGGRNVLHHYHVWLIDRDTYEEFLFEKHGVRLPRSGLAGTLEALAEAL